MQQLKRLRSDVRRARLHVGVGAGSFICILTAK